MIQTKEIQLIESENILQLFAQNIEKVEIIGNHLVLQIGLCFYSIYYFESEVIIKIFKHKKMSTDFKPKKDFSEIDKEKIESIVVAENLIHTEYTESGRIDYQLYESGDIQILKKYLYEFPENDAQSGVFASTEDFELFKIQ